MNRLLALPALVTKRGRYVLGLRHPRLRRLWRPLSPLRALHTRRNERIGAAFVLRYGATVRRGPFAGLEFPTSGPDGARFHVSMLLGSFESELHPLLARVLERPRSEAVNIGSGSGYYAVGLARAWPEAVVHAFEELPGRRAATAELARVNRVAGRVRVHGRCDADALRALDLTAPFILCDCEGCEVDVLDPQAVSFLDSATLLVELHELERPGSSAILARFAATHERTLIDSRPKSASDFGELEDFPPRQAAVAVAEPRLGRTQWAYLVPR
jgi:hypothetical protein